MSVQTAQAERGAKIQTNNEKQNKQQTKVKCSDVQASWSIVYKNDGTGDENRSLTSINQSSLPRRSGAGRIREDLNKGGGVGRWVSGI